MTTSKDLSIDINLLIQNIARIYANEGNAKYVSILAKSQASAEQTGYDNWDGGIYEYTVHLDVPHQIYSEIVKEIDDIAAQIISKLDIFIHHYDKASIRKLFISPALIDIDNWQVNAINWLSGAGVTNQGRVRSNNIANREHDGLLFRSQAEIHFYDALKSAGVAFAPLPVFLRGGETYSRIEPDFIIVKDGITMCIEIDGDTVHSETPAEAYSRTRILTNEGVIVERFLASECSNPASAKLLAKRVLELIQKHKKNRV
jgi:hypothetical protein